jgi:PmbA protein
MDDRAEPGIDSLKELVDAVLRQARELGASQAEASASFGAGLSVTVRMRDVETLEYHRDQGLGITVYFGQRKGNASTSDLGEAAVAESVRKACTLARFAAEDESAGLADADELAGETPDLDLYHPWAIEPPEAIELAIEGEAAALDADERITNSEGASLSSNSGCRVYGNTHGFLAGYRSSQHSLSCAVLASEGAGMERDFDYTVARDPGELASPAAVGREAAQRAIARLGARKLDTAITPVLFPARLARSLFGHFLGAISGGSLYRKASFIPRGLASAPFDDEGVTTRERRLVDGGVLNGYVLGSYYARKLGMRTTGNAGGIHNLVVSNTGQSLAGLLLEMDRGFLVSELMGQGINMVTGDYSRGAAGFWVENGSIQYPVSEVTVAGNLRDVYRGIAAIGADTDYRGGIRTGSILVSQMTVAGN